ncbi:hypothetical protein M434DRAFT_27369 [Hypoxylon sp. CO27-5]|nr:hypothetical protein M434DRAFT_27369 [Hypoxylon sp. CO27-5]
MDILFQYQTFHHLVLEYLSSMNLLSAESFTLDTSSTTHNSSSKAQDPRCLLLAKPSSQPLRKAAGTHSNTEQSYMLEEYLRSEPTISERCAGLANSNQINGETKSHLEKAKDQIKLFDDIWAKNTGDGK